MDLRKLGGERLSRELWVGSILEGQGLETNKATIQLLGQDFNEENVFQNALSIAVRANGRVRSE